MKNYLKISIFILVMFLLTGCSDTSNKSYQGELTLDFNFGSRTGFYDGEVDENNLPNGYGTFTSMNEKGNEWTYEGNWANGHWNGKGTSIWSSGEKYVGNYVNDIAKGKGVYYFSNGESIDGEFIDDSNAVGVYTDSKGVKYYAKIDSGNIVKNGIWRKGNLDAEMKKYQGEWAELDDSYSSIIISGESVNIISQMTIGSKYFCHVSTFYFDYNKEGELVVVNEGGSQRYNIGISHDVLKISDDSSSKEYKKISDNIDVPNETYEPKVGMTKEEIYGSTWGNPKKVNKTTTAYSEREQWVYDHGYIYFENDIVYAIQD